MSDTHYVGQHAGVPQKRLEELSSVFGKWLYETINNDDPTFCECQVIEKCVEVGQIPAEIAVLAYISARVIGEMGIVSALASMAKDSISSKGKDGKLPN